MMADATKKVAEQGRYINHGHPSRRNCIYVGSIIVRTIAWFRRDQAWWRNYQKLYSLCGNAQTSRPIAQQRLGLWPYDPYFSSKS